MLAVLLVVASGASLSSQVSRVPGFELEDYAKLCIFEDLHLAPDGDFVVYATRPLLQGNSDSRREVFVLATAAGAEPMRLALPATARAIRWAGSSHLLAFLADDQGVAQVYLYDWEKQRLSRISDAVDSVVAFELSNSGKSLAYVTKSKSDAAKAASSSLYASLRRSGPGILIDTDTVGLNEVIDPHYAMRVHQPNATLWVSAIGKAPKRIEVPGDPGSYISEMHWSGDDSMISLVYIADDIPLGSSRLLRPSLGVISIQTGKFHNIAAATTSAASGQSFRWGDWIPGQQKLVIERATIKPPSSGWGHPDWAVVSPRALQDQPHIRWHKVDAVFGAKIHPITPRLLLVENTLRAAASLYEWSDRGERRSEIVARIDGATSQFSFARNATTVAFVSESMIRPPEIYLYKKEMGVRRLSAVNQEIAAKITASVSEVSWKSADGTTVQGWLLSPDRSWAKPWPIVTFLHGGPTIAVTNEFTPYWTAWPYPFAVYAAKGIGVFFPNYRGSGTFGAAFQTPTELDQEPIDDVVSGVDYLIDSGIADKSKLGLSGHSYGAWLGPMVLTRFSIFRACSFAEGWGNTIETYELLEGKFLRETWDSNARWGGSLYDVPTAPARMLELSPDLHFDKVRSANLFESGAESDFLKMLSLGKASVAKGLPTESITYPLTGHNPTDPGIQRETAQRNADWFMFWLRDEERQDEDAAPQYERWRAAKAHASAFNSR